MGGKGDKPETMSANDMIRLAKEQSRLNEGLVRQQTAANRPEQITPYGRTVWEDLGNDQWRQTTTLNPDEQRALDAQMGVKAGRSELAEEILGRASDELGEAAPWEAMDPNQVDASGDVRQSAEDALYGRATSRLDPMFEQKREEMENRLWNQGLRPGDEAYDTAMGNLGRQETDAYQTAMNQSIAGGGAEASRTFGMDMQRRQQAIAEILKRRGVTINEINALNAGMQVDTPEFAGFAQQGRSKDIDLVGAAQQGTQNEWDKYNAQQAQGQGTMEGITGLMAAAAPLMMMSDRRLKTNIVHIGFTPGGQRVYEYDIFNIRFPLPGRRFFHMICRLLLRLPGRGYPYLTHQVGVMADESPPEAVALHPSGYLMVDYSRIK